MPVVTILCCHLVNVSTTHTRVGRLRRKFSVFLSKLCHWPAYWVSIVLLGGWRLLSSVVCRYRLSSSVTLPAGGPAGRVDGRRAGDRARGWLGGRHCTAGQSCYVPLGRHLVIQVIMPALDRYLEEMKEQQQQQQLATDDITVDVYNSDDVVDDGSDCHQAAFDRRHSDGQCFHFPFSKSPGLLSKVDFANSLISKSILKIPRSFGTWW